MDDDQQQRYWFPYWTSPPPPRPPVRPSPPVAPSPSRRPSTQHQPTTTTTSRGATSPQAQAQAQVSSSSRPSPSRAAPLAPITAPRGDNQLQRRPSSITPPAAHESAPEQKDVIILPQDKAVLEPAAAAAHPKSHGKAKGKDRKTPKDKDKKKEEEEEEEEEDKKKSHGGEQGKLQEGIKAGVADMVQKVGAYSGHERAGGTSVITLAGENNGASMKVGATNKDKERHGHRLDDGGKEEGGKGLTALINSNVQVINNSLLLQSSCSGGDPGVHLKLSAKSMSKDKQQQQTGSADGGKAAAASATRSAAKK